MDEQRNAPIEVIVDRSEPARTVRVVGDAGLANVDLLSQQLLKLLAQRPKLVIFDVSGLTFICSLAIGSFMEFHRGVKDNGGEVRFAGMTPPIEEVFTRANLQHVFGVYRNVEEAQAAT